MIRNRVVISLPETIHRNSQCGGAPSRLSGELGDEVFDIRSLILFPKTLVEHVDPIIITQSYYRIDQI